VLHAQITPTQHICRRCIGSRNFYRWYVGKN